MVKTLYEKESIKFIGFINVQFYTFGLNRMDKNIVHEIAFPIESK